MSVHEKTLEDHILGCWQITDEIGLVFESVMEDDSMTKDEIANILLGLQQLYARKFDALFRKYEQQVGQGKLKPYIDLDKEPDDILAKIRLRKDAIEKNEGWI
jgi:hypothetical protein